MDIIIKIPDELIKTSLEAAIAKHIASLQIKEPLMIAKEAAAYMRVDTTTVYKLVVSKTRPLPHGLVGKTGYRFRKSELDEYMDRYKRKGKR